LNIRGKKSKTINRKGAQALRNSPVGYFSEGARLQGWQLRKDLKELKYSILSLRALRLLRVL
jgi:hypothetical protein